MARILCTPLSILMTAALCFVSFSLWNSAGGYNYPKSMIPCKLFNTSRLDCHYRELVAIPPLPPNITHLDLSHNRLSGNSLSNFSGQFAKKYKRQKSIFSGQVNLTHLDLSYNRLENISGSPFENLPSLKFLYLGHAVIRNLSSSSFTGLHNLQVLSICFNPFRTLPNDVFTDLGSLKVLTLRTDRLSSISSQVVAPLHHLNKLVLARFVFTPELLGEGFSNLTSLSTFELQVTIQNKDRFFTNKTFQNLNNSPLRSFKFSIHKYMYSPPIIFQSGIFRPLKYLTNLSIIAETNTVYTLVSLKSDLHELKIPLQPPNKTLTSTSFHHLTTQMSALESLDLSDSHIYEIYDKAFANFSGLKILKINNVVLRRMTKYAFSGLYRLEELHLSENQIHEDPFQALNAFKNSRSLQVLNLCCNEINTVDYLKIPSLTLLDLSNNPLTDFSNPTFRLPNLTHLKLHSLKSLNFRMTFKSLQSLIKLDLSRPINKHVLNGLPHAFSRLQELFLAGVYIKVSTLQNFCKNLSELIVLETPESFANIFDFPIQWGLHIQFPKLKVLNLASNKLRQINIMKFNETTPSVQHLDLSDNKIQEVSNDIFSSLIQLHYLNLADNFLYELDMLLDMNSLLHLDLSLNNLNEISTSFLQSIKTYGLQTLNMSGNPYTCTCAILPFQKWIHSDIQVYLEPFFMYKCASPNNLGGMSITEFKLDCSINFALYISISVCSGFLICLTIMLVIHFRWHIKYKLFLLFNRRRRQQQEPDEDGNELNRLGYDAFVSYAHENNIDSKWVLDELRVNMEEGPDPIALCIGHARDFIPGTPLLEAITEAIHNSRKTIVVLSPNYLDSEWCYFEMQHAWLRLLNEGQDVIIMVLLDPIPANRMTMWLRQFLCKKGYLKWPLDRVGQNLFWQYLREKIKQPARVNRRYDV